jgi:hypothetical protein
MRPKLGPSKPHGATVLSRALQTKGGELPPEGASFILNLGIRDVDKRRLLKLLAKNQKGPITAEESEELESYVEADNILSTLKAQAILALKKAGRKP